MSGGRESGREPVFVRAARRGVILALLAASFVVLRTGRDALYIGDDGLLALPRAYMVQAALSVVQAMAMLALLRRLGLRPVRLFALFSAAAVGIAYVVYGRPGGGWPMTLLFVAVALVFSIAFSLSWAHGVELVERLALDKAGTARAYSRLGAASIAGGVAGGAIARLAGPALGPRPLLAIGTVLVFAAAVMTALAHRGLPQSPAAAAKATRAPPDAVRAPIPGLGLFVAVAMAAAITGVFVDFQFYLGAAGGSEDERMTYLANVYLFLSVVSLVLQLWVTPWLSRTFGARRALLVLPCALALGGALALTSGSIFARAALRVADGGLKRGVHQSSWEQTLSGYPAEARPRLKILVDGMATRIAEGIAGALLLGWIHLAADYVRAGGAMASMRVGWVAALSGNVVTLGLLIAAMSTVIFTLLLGRRIGRLGAEAQPADDQPVPLAAEAPAECCQITMAEASRMLEDASPAMRS